MNFELRFQKIILTVRMNLPEQVSNVGDRVMTVGIVMTVGYYRLPNWVYCENGLEYQKGAGILTCLFGTYTCLFSVHTHAPKSGLVLA